MPENIGELPSLEHLDLSHNKLHKLPNSIGELKSLRILNIGNNQLIEIPEALGDFPSLTGLSMNNSKLQQLPGFITKLNTLLSLDLSYNELRDLPDWLSNIQLTDIDLSNNRFATVPNCIFKMPIDTLYLSSNQIHFIPDAIGSLQHLIDLNLMNNRLVFLPGELGNLPSLQALNVAMNHLTILPRSLENIPNSEINASYNPLNPEEINYWKEKIPGFEYVAEPILSIPLKRLIVGELLMNRDHTRLVNLIVHLTGIRRLVTFGNNFTIQPIMDLINGKEVLRGIYYRDANGNSNAKINAFLTKFALINGLDFLDFKQEYLRYSGTGSPLLDHLRRIGGIADLSTVLNKWRK